MEYSEAEKQMLREVLPGIAVQLRGALANIHGALGRLAPERLRDRDTGTDRSAAILCQSYYKILRVVNNLSDAPMLAEDKPLDTENVELVELLEGLCRQGQVLAELMDLRLVFTCRDRAHVIAANRELLERLFWNLVSNAMKFTPPGGHIAHNGHLVLLGRLRQGQGTALSGLLADDAQLLQVLQVKVHRGGGLQPHGLADLPHRGGIPLVLDGLDDVVIDFLLHFGQLGHDVRSFTGYFFRLYHRKSGFATDVRGFFFFFSEGGKFQFFS